MTNTAAMLESHPTELAGIDRDTLAECIDACYECAQTCALCADACMNEEHVAHLVTCISTDLTCADFCLATGRILSRVSTTEREVLERALETCRDICAACGEDCESHADMHDHCAICAEACRRCEDACESLLAQL